MQYKTVLFPLPKAWSLVPTVQKAGSKPAAIAARMRSMVAPFTVQDGDEVTTTKPSGNSGHNVPLNAEQAEIVRTIIATLAAAAAEYPDTKQGKADAEAAAEAAAELIAELQLHGGIRLPVNRKGRTASQGEDIGSLFASFEANDEDTDEDTDEG